MTHFRPICLMPLSVSNNADRIVSVPPIRQKNTKKDILKIYKPIKTKFRKKLTSVRRRSAFVIFQAIKPLLNAGKLLTEKASSKKATISKPLLAKANSIQSETTPTDMFETEAASTPELRNNHQTQQQQQHTGRSQKQTKTVQTRKTSKCCDSTKTTRSNREKILQEKEDFQLAKMLQECIGTTDAPSRYSLRSRNKSSVSSLSSTSSSQELFHSKGYAMGTTQTKYKKTIQPFADTTTAATATTKDTVGRSQRNNGDTNDKFIDFSFQKLTRSRRIAMTMSGV
ncbi:uncharacterized protein LOC129566648 [Sitodiplosis mosellana]|uniref:uncharacterized protein LOC129566648 n=1 Tax=Sitodiplosis mosellana TaxID=263140 RepID=UPI002444202A|nr:uncharacterized protein LOC129566648 [Sitodiplosis mosellana]